MPLRKNAASKDRTRSHSAPNVDPHRSNQYHFMKPGKGVGGRIWLILTSSQSSCQSKSSPPVPDSDSDSSDSRARRKRVHHKPNYTQAAQPQSIPFICTRFGQTGTHSERTSKLTAPLSSDHTSCTGGGNTIPTIRWVSSACCRYRASRLGLGAAKTSRPV